MGVASEMETDVKLVIGKLDLLLNINRKASLDVAFCSRRIMVELDISLTTRTVQSILTVERRDRLLPMTISPVTASNGKSSASATLSITAMEKDVVDASATVSPVKTWEISRSQK